MLKETPLNAAKRTTGAIRKVTSTYKLVNERKMSECFVYIGTSVGQKKKKSIASQQIEIG